MKTILFGRFGRVHVVVHSEEMPSTSEWDAYVADLEQSVPVIAGLFAWTVGGGPNASQRRATQAMWARVGVRRPIAVCNGSTVVRGIITALNWIVGQQLRSFPLEATADALASLGLEPGEYGEIADALERFAAELQIRDPALGPALAALRQDARAGRAAR